MESQENTDRPLPPPPWHRRLYRRVLLLFATLLCCAVLGGPLAVALEDHPRYASWRDARAGSTERTGLAPATGPGTPAVVQVYAARTWGYRRAFAVHTWIAVKPADADRFERLHVVGWRARGGRSVVVREPGWPDLPWYGARPELVLDRRGEEAARLIPEILAATEAYPWQREYRAWPGPNSNTFTAWVGREVPELRLDLPATAIGKDFAPLSDALGRSSSGTGLRATLFGVAGLSAGIEEGVELNLFGLHLELDLLDLAIELPGWGRVGAAPVPSDS